MYIGSIPVIVYRFFSEKIYILYTKLFYTHSIITSYIFTLLIIALRFLHRHVFLAFLTGGTMNL